MRINSDHILFNLIYFKMMNHQYNKHFVPSNFFVFINEGHIIRRKIHSVRIRYYCKNRHSGKVHFFEFIAILVVCQPL